MKYEELKNFILNEMKMQQNRNYQPVMIRFLNQNKGKATREQIQQALHYANPEFSVKYFSDSSVFDVLTTNHPVADYNLKEDMYSLFDYDTYTTKQKSWITRYCEEKIRNSANPIMNRVILFSVSGKKSYEHFRDTITTNVVTDTLTGNSILKDFPELRVWGSIDNQQNYNKWKDLKKGDVLLFYHDKHYIASAILEGTEQNYDIATQLWDYKDPETKQAFELIMFMLPQNVSDENVEYGKLNQLLGYEEEFMPTRTLDFTTVNKDRTDNLAKKFQTIENALSSIGFSLKGGSKNVTPIDIEELIKKFDQNRNLFWSEYLSVKNETLKYRDDFLAKFPISHIPDMKLDDYVIGKLDETTQDTRRDTFSYYLEKSLKAFGEISGRWSRFHGIYWKKDQNRYQWNGNFKNENEAFAAIKNQISSMLSAAQTLEKDGDWNKFAKFMDTQDRTVMANVKNKILCVYFPHLFLTLHKKQLLDDVLHEFHVKFNKIESRYLKEKKILDVKMSNPIMKNWDNLDFSHFLWEALLSKEEDSIEEATEVETIVDSKTQHVDYLTPEDFENFLNAVPKLEAFNQPGQKPPMSAEQFQLLFRILYGSALKIFDALNIRVKDLDLDNRIIRISDSTSKFPYATILPTDVSYLKEYVSTLQKDDKLFDVHRATLWNYAKQVGNLAGLKIFRGKEERETEGMDLLIFRESRAMQMSLDGARDGLIRRKLRVDFFDSVLKYDRPTIEDLKEWELNPIKFSQKLPKIKSNLESFVDQTLSKPSSSEIKAGLEKIKEKLLIPDEKIIEIVTSLASGSHVILAGPIGTGKTELARKIPQIFWSKNGGYYSDIFTATADWNTQDVIGGIIPKMDGDKVKYKIQDGCVTESVRKNWDGKIRKYHSEGGNFRGVWTIIDEFNRADIDKAFGQLFTALRTRELKVPTDLLNESHESLKIPKDFRIIGTLNTADKHYLFPLSDALKSRFSFIEVDVPDPTLKDAEIYYAMKNAIDSFDEEDYNSIVSLGDKQNIIKRNDKFYAAAYQAYNFLAFVRLFKKLGTAILKMIFQHLLAGAKMSLNFNDVLDNAINSIIIPQLERMSESQLEAIKCMHNGKLVEYFQEQNKSSKRANSEDAFKKTLEFLKISDKAFDDFANKEIKEPKTWEKLKQTYDQRKQKIDESLAQNLNQVENSLNSLIEQSVI